MRGFIPGIRMYKGKKTLFYNGESLYNENGYPLIYDKEEQNSWEVIIVLPGVERVPYSKFSGCRNVKTVIMADTVKRIGGGAFHSCFSLKFVKFSRYLEFIGDCAFQGCDSLSSIFIPPSCRWIDYGAFFGCRKLLILSVPLNTQLVGKIIIDNTELLKACPFGKDEYGYYGNNEQINAWIKSVNLAPDDKYALHRECSAFKARAENICAIMKRVGVQAFREPNLIGVTPTEYLEANYFAEIDEGKIINRYILDLMGETV